MPLGLFAFWVISRRAKKPGFLFAVGCVFLWRFAEDKAFLSRAFWRSFFLERGSSGTKKGGVDDLGKLRRGAQRSGAILTFFFSLRAKPEPPEAVSFKMV